jgi:hypothetical protein
MNLQDIINAAADDADEFLRGVRTMTEARPAIREYLAANHPKLSPGDSARVIAGLLAVLEEEGFFEAKTDGDMWSEESGGTESAE